MGVSQDEKALKYVTLQAFLGFGDSFSQFAHGHDRYAHSNGYAHTYGHGYSHVWNVWSSAIHKHHPFRWDVMKLAACSCDGWVVHVGPSSSLFPQGNSNGTHTNGPHTHGADLSVSIPRDPITSPNVNDDWGVLHHLQNAVYLANSQKVSKVL